MKALITALSLVFIIQCAMVAIRYWPEAGIMEMMSSKALVPFEPYRVDEIHVGDSDGNEAVLLKAGDHWILPDLSGLAISPKLIDKLLVGVLEAETGWPVASSVAARQRFQVADYHFQKRLTLIGSGELLGTVYLGTSPGFRKVHARNSIHDSIYAIAFSAHEASAIDNLWLDKRTLQIPTPLSISTDNYSVHKDGSTWRNAKGTKPDQRELEALLLALASLQIESVASQDLQQTLSIAVPEIRMDIKSADGSTTFELFTLGDEHYIHCSNHSLFFSLSAYDFDRFATLDSQRLNESTL